MANRTVDNSCFRPTMQNRMLPQPRGTEGVIFSRSLTGGAVCSFNKRFKAIYLNVFICNFALPVGDITT